SDLCRAGRRVVPDAHLAPQRFVVDAVPWGECPAPVEDDRLDRHAPILSARAGGAAGQKPGARAPRGPWPRPRMRATFGLCVSQEWADPYATAGACWPDRPFPVARC